MNLRSLDLNLLLVFDAIYAERSISKAAQRLNLSQPAVSNALARLRDRLGDPLFERSSQGMTPTPRAKALKEPIHQALDLLEQGLRNDSTFDYASSVREFVIAVEDYGETVILPRLVDWAAAAAPNIRITIRAESSASLKEAMRDGSVDLALDYFTVPTEGYVNKRVMTETLVTLARKEHPHISDRLNLETYLEQRHVVISPRGRVTPMIDLALSKRNLQRKIALVVPHFLSMPTMVRSSNMICTLPRRMAYHFADAFGLNVHAVPVRTPAFPVYLIWHESFDGDPGHQWLRNHLIALCESL